MATMGQKRSRALRIGVASAAALAVATAGTLGYLYLHLNGNIKTYSSAGIAASRPPKAVAATTTAAGEPQASAPLNLLLIGSDSRSNNNTALGGGEGVDGARSDTTILLHISGDRKHAIGVSIPRDALVDVPSCEANGIWLPAQTHVMFNSAFAEGDLPDGNPICTQNTVEAMTGIRIDHTVVVDFTGFAAMATAVGGVQVCVPAVNNTYLEHEYGITLGSGMQTLSGKAALEYVRAREGFGDGSDVGRMKRQQAFLSALMKQVLSAGTLENPITLYNLADAATSALTVDSSLDSPSALVSLALEIKQVPLANMEFVTTPWQYDGARIDLIQPDTDDLWALLREDRTLEGQDVSGDAAEYAGASASSSAGPSDGPTASASVLVAASAASDRLAATRSRSKAGGSASASASSTPVTIPSGITDNIRKADSDPCSDLTFGN
jgi:LCP family protein required for cell wall assembly